MAAAAPGAAGARGCGGRRGGGAERSGGERRGAQGERCPGCCPPAASPARPDPTSPRR